MPNSPQIASPRIAKQLEAAMAWAEARPTAVEQALAATWLLNELQAAVQALPKVRAKAVRELHEDGFSMKDLSEMLGLSKSRIQQLLDAPDKKAPGRARLPRCEWSKTNGEPCEHAGVYRTNDSRRVCGTHAGLALNDGLTLTEA